MFQVRTELFHVDGRTDMKLIVVFLNFAKEPKNESQMFCCRILCFDSGESTDCSLAGVAVCVLVGCQSELPERFEGTCRFPRHGRQL
jgi:hypothetical protein